MAKKGYNPWNNGELSADPYKAVLNDNAYYAFLLSDSNPNVKHIFTTSTANFNPTSEKPRPEENILAEKYIQCFYCADYKLSSSAEYRGLTFIPKPRLPICNWTKKINFPDWNDDGIGGIYDSINSYAASNKTNAEKYYITSTPEDKTYAYMCYNYMSGFSYKLGTLEDGTKNCYPTGQTAYPTGPYIRIPNKIIGQKPLGKAYDFVVLGSSGSNHVESLTYISLASNCTLYNNNQEIPRTDVEPLSAPSTDTIIANDYLTYLSGQICKEAERRRMNKNYYIRTITDKLNTYSYGSKQNDIINHNTLTALNSIILSLSKRDMHYDYNISDITATLPLSNNNELSRVCNTNNLIAANALSVLVQNLEYIRHDCICYSNCGLYAVCYCFGNQSNTMTTCTVNSSLLSGNSPYL